MYRREGSVLRPGVYLRFVCIGRKVLFYDLVYI